MKQNEESGVLEDVILVREGFNLFASVFNIFWFLFNKLWLFATLAFCIINIAYYILSAYIYGVFMVLFLLLIGFEANNLLLYRFQREKYYFSGYSMGNSEREAKLRFLDNINKNGKEKNNIIY
ncbi:MAG: DUF2628 domain-containing protein [Rickettsiales bacterium]|nr:DUF2628 domain-containing protein [Rickettsiales bacterium]